MQYGNKKRVWWNASKSIWRHVLMRVGWHAWIRTISIILMWILFFYTPWNSFLGGPWVVNVCSNMVIWGKLACLRPISTSVIAVGIKTQ